MDIAAGMDNSVIDDIVKAFSGTIQDLVYEVKQEYGWDTENFKNGGMWDARFNRIKYAALKNDLVVLMRKRGIWTFVCVLNPDTGILYVFSKEKNLEAVAKNFGRKNIHYFHAFVSLNSEEVDLENKQMSLFPKLTDDYEARRIEEVQKILGEDYPLVEQVVFIVAKEENREIVGVEAKLYNRFFEPLDTENWTLFVPKDEYSRILGVEEENVDNTDNNSIILPKVKQQIKNRRDMLEKEIALKKEDRKEDSNTGNKG